MKTSEYLDRKFASGKARKCWMCQCALSRGTATVDHLTPRSAKGKDEIGNYRLACSPCNSARMSKPLSKADKLALKGRERPKPRDYSKLIQCIRDARKVKSD